MQSCESRVTSSLLKTPPEELYIELEGKKLTQEDSFVYRKGIVRRREDGERCRPRPTSESTGRSEHVESS